MTDIPDLLLPPGSYWCAVVSHHDRSGILGAYGPYPSKDAAEGACARLRETGVHEYDLWEARPLHALGLGPAPGALTSIPVPIRRRDPEEARALLLNGPLPPDLAAALADEIAP